MNGKLKRRGLEMAPPSARRGCSFKPAAIGWIKVRNVAIRHRRLWQWRLQTEKGRALIGLGERAEGFDLLRGAVTEMNKAGSLPWQVAYYQRLLHDAHRVALR